MAKCWPPTLGKTHPVQCVKAPAPCMESSHLVHLHIPVSPAWPLGNSRGHKVCVLHSKMWSIRPQLETLPEIPPRGSLDACGCDHSSHE